MALTLTYPAGGMLVTGGTGRVGEGIVRKLAEAGVPLLFTYRGNAAKAEALVAEMRAEGHRVAATVMDMTDANSIRAALDRAEAEYGGLHGIACGAGMVVGFNKIADFSLEEIERFIDGDALGYYRIFHAAIPMMRKTGGSITTCTTMATRRVIAYDGISPFSKGSVDALIRQVAFEEAEHGIRCNGVAVGWVESCSMNESRTLFAGETPKNPANEMERVTALMHQIHALAKLGRPVTPSEAGTLFAFLASDQASYLTGQTIALDAGVLL